MWFGFRPRVVKRCERGHVLQATWRTCPQCSGAEPEGGAGDRGTLSETVIQTPVSSEGRTEAGLPAGSLLRLVVEAGPDAGQQLVLAAGRWKLGRIPRAQEGYRLVAFEHDGGMSRDHVALEVGPAAVVVRDLGSTNGTFVNGTRVERHVLEEGDVLQLGETQLRALVAGQGPG